MRLPETARSLKSSKFILFRGLLFVQTTHQGMSEATIMMKHCVCSTRWQLLTLSQPEGQIRPTTLRVTPRPPDFQTFLRPCETTHQGTSEATTMMKRCVRLTRWRLPQLHCSHRPRPLRLRQHVQPQVRPLNSYELPRLLRLPRLLPLLSPRS